ILIIALDIERDLLYKRIERRVDAMINNGLVEEVEKLRAMGYTQDLNSQKAIGYIQLHRALNNEISLSDAIEEIKLQTKHYAKRQITWFKRYNPLWMAADDCKGIKKIISEWIECL
ncbi:MAG: tRNA (adenosine(37)-N6)-dimethylallyltransferase MiaA, partial [Spirochaetes bacterium]|nr:tRNA (adenosine(37)-N6)-dimethylallyltransferase MiaA [Spirochaetota bacterium]